MLVVMVGPEKINSLLLSGHFLVPRHSFWGGQADAEVINMGGYTSAPASRQKDRTRTGFESANGQERTIKGVLSCLRDRPSDKKKHQ